MADLPLTPDEQLVEDVGDMLWRIEGNYHREGTGPGSRFAGQRLEIVQARQVIRHVRATANWAAGLDVWGPVDKAIRAAERERLAATLDHRAHIAEHAGDSVMAGHLRGAARIVRQADTDPPKQPG